VGPKEGTLMLSGWSSEGPGSSPPLGVTQEGGQENRGHQEEDGGQAGVHGETRRELTKI